MKFQLSLDPRPDRDILVAKQVQRNKTDKNKNLATPFGQWFSKQPTAVRVAVVAGIFASIPAAIAAISAICVATLPFLWTLNSTQITSTVSSISSGTPLSTPASTISVPISTQNTLPPDGWQLIHDSEFGNMDVRWYHRDGSLLFNETYLVGLLLDESFYSEAKFQSIQDINNRGYGFIFRFNYEENSYYYFVIGDEQNFGIYLNREGQTSGLFISRSDKIMRGRVNKLGILGEGAKYKFFINDEMVAELEDLQVEGNQIGFISPKSVIAHEYVRIDQFRLYAPP